MSLLARGQSFKNVAGRRQTDHIPPLPPISRLKYPTTARCEVYQMGQNLTQDPVAIWEVLHNRIALREGHLGRDDDRFRSIGFRPVFHA